MQDAQGNAVSFPITVSAGTTYDNMPEYNFVNNTDGETIHFYFDFDFSVKAQSSNAKFYRNFTMTKSGNSYSITLGLKSPIVNNVIANVYDRYGQFDHTSSVKNGWLIPYLALPDSLIHDYMNG